ncbi:hypothetical protein ACFWMR_19430 [Amycolatopsis thailandensis]|uniref:hypothetical protein n=1 Tax=Amycolatopsis thailandensis TaxID=589330 RepID=UPI003660CF6A
MNWVHAGLWGLTGGFIVEGLELYVAVRQKGAWPWRVTGEGPTAGPAAYAVAETIRMLIGGILAAATAASGQVAGPLAAVAIGVAAPVMVGHLTALLPIPMKPADAPGVPDAVGCKPPAQLDGAPPPLPPPVRHPAENQER